MPVIKNVYGREILDSRGRPTIEATCELADGTIEFASVPSGASTGTSEALELRDGDPKRYRGLGCRQAALNINTLLCHALSGKRFDSQEALDKFLIAADGTDNKARLGANALLGVSMAFARAHARSMTVPLYEHFSQLLSRTVDAMPRLTINLFSGGRHAGQQIAIQDVLIIPTKTETIDDTVRVAFDVYHAAAELVQQRYGMRLLTADEGGLAPPCRNTDEALTLAVDSIEAAGYVPGSDISLGVDVAATQFVCGSVYKIDGRELSSESMISTIEGWVHEYPILFIEDGLSEEDWGHWPSLCEALSPRVLTIGDDLLCTNPARIRRAVQRNACDALLLKVNQVGTITEALEALKLARDAGWSVVVSVRSGETEDNWAADLAVGAGADYFKGGSITQSERLAKYNRLLDIAQKAHLRIAPLSW